MRLIVLMIVVFSMQSQGVCKNRFLVIAIEGHVNISKSKVLKVKDYVRNKQTIKVSKNSYVALLHESGYSLEYFGDTVVNLADINQSGPIVSGLDFDKLFWTTGVIYSYCDYKNIHIYHPPFDIRVNKNDSLCLKWIDHRVLKDSNAISYLITIVDLLGDTIFGSRTKELYSKIDYNDFDLAKPMLLSISALGFDDSILDVSETHLIHKEFLPGAQAISCNKKITSANCILIAFFLERHGAIDLSRKYFDEAISLAKYPKSFERLKRNFDIRHL